MQNDQIRQLSEAELKAGKIYDEGAAKHRKLAGVPGAIVAFVCFACTSVHLLGMSFLPMDPLLFRAISLHGMGIVAFLVLPTTKNPKWKTKISLFDYVVIALSVALLIYIGDNFKELQYRAGFRPTDLDILFAVIAVFLVTEMTRRLIGWILPCVAAFFFLYAMFGNYIPGLFAHRGYPVARILSMLLSTEGFYGAAMSAASTYIVMFVTFAAFLGATGVGDFFTRIATAFAGGTRGGPAKVAVVSSALMGTVSGSAMGNVVTTGSFTIPLMKKNGYEPHFAGAVEAAASTGGQIMPPVMGAVAFVLAEFIGVPYSVVMTAAIIPATVYFTSIFFMIDFQAEKLKLRPIPKDERKNPVQVLKDGGYLIIPLIALIVDITVFNHSIIRAAFLCIALSILISWTFGFKRKENRLTLKRGYKAIQEGSTGAMEAVSACGTAGIVIGVLSMTGLGQSIGGGIVQLAGNNTLITLFCVMIFSLILGMGMPTVPAYILAASVGAPALIKLGVPVLPAHFFVMYFATISTITPPVALAGYAAAGIAQADPNKTSWTAAKLGVAAFLCPYIFVYDNAMLAQNVSAIEAIWCGVTALIGSYGLACCIGSNYKWYQRIIALAAALALIDPGLLTDTVGFGLLAMVMLLHRVDIKKEKTSMGDVGTNKVIRSVNME